MNTGGMFSKKLKFLFYLFRLFVVGVVRSSVLILDITFYPKVFKRVLFSRRYLLFFHRKSSSVFGEMDVAVSYGFWLHDQRERKKFLVRCVYVQLWQSMGRISPVTDPFQRSSCRRHLVNYYIVKFQTLLVWGTFE